MDFICTRSVPHTNKIAFVDGTVATASSEELAKVFTVKFRVYGNLCLTPSCLANRVRRSKTSGGEPSYSVQELERAHASPLGTHRRPDRNDVTNFSRFFLGEFHVYYCRVMWVSKEAYMPEVRWGTDSGKYTHTAQVMHSSVA